MIKVDGVPVEIGRYPDGTLRLEAGAGPGGATVEWLYERDEEMALYFIARHLRGQCGAGRMTLRMPYIPNARMDRVKEAREVFTLKHFCEFVNLMGFDEVIVRDPHSDISLSMLDNAVVEPVGDTVRGLVDSLLDPRRDIVFYPDEGSLRRYSAMVDFPYAYGVKDRDWNTGRISGLKVRGTLPPAPFNALIVDDISSYGGTFLLSARKLKDLGAGKVYLYVTHCEDSILKGELIGSDLIDRIYTTKSIFTGDHPLIEVIGGAPDG
ncbi:MAG: hypothetical protein FWH47_02535 [Methanomassiliicoccaceae archaeon]|nr:hypothetical protein [Methanomassiliicoccaceae archaeon]